jgi:hypothetical protein
VRTSDVRPTLDNDICEIANKLLIELCLSSVRFFSPTYDKRIIIMLEHL